MQMKLNYEKFLLQKPFPDHRTQQTNPKTRSKQAEGLKDILICRSGNVLRLANEVQPLLFCPSRKGGGIALWWRGKSEKLKYYNGTRFL